MSEETKAVAYYRMSSDKQEASIGDQRTSVEKFAADNGYKIVREYVDEAISGWKAEQRKGFQRLITDAGRKEFEAVLCWDQDRFSRFPVLEANHYWYLLDRAGVHIATVAQGRLNFNDLGEWLKASVVQHGKAEYLRDLARNSARGVRKRKLAGQWVGCAPLGYRLNGGRLELGDVREISLVRRIFDMRARGYGHRAIAAALNGDGVPSPRNCGWRAESVRHILQRDAYIGNTVVSKVSRAKYERLTPEPVTIENTHPPIIDRATWDAVRAMTKLRRRANGRNGSEGAPLSGLLTCGRCGQPMYSKTIRGYDYYLCSSYSGKGKCGHCQVRREPIFKAVATKIREHILLGSRERLESAIQRELDRRVSQRPNASALRVKIESLDRQIARAGDRLLAVDDSLVPDLSKRLLALKQQRDQLATVVTDQPIPARQTSAKAIASKAWELDRVLTAAPATTVRHVLQQFIEYIRLEFEPIGNTRRGKRYGFVGGIIKLLSQETQFPANTND